MGAGSRARLGRVLAWALLPLAVYACSKSSSGNPSGPSDPGEAAFLVQHNARFNDGKTVRWADLPIRVFANGIAGEDEVTEWTRATGGKVTFTFVGSASGANIKFRFGSGNDVCGLTTVEYTSDGTITSADVQVVQAVFRGPQCQRTVVHETGHSIGMLDHTADGGLMDPDGGDGRITDPVARMFVNLYSLAPGTIVGNARTPRTEQRAGGRRSITIIDPVRR